jgi:F0F1-type ATP synthase membrane subunit b/b'
LPQLAVETFPSQVFWVLFGFFAVYVFVSNVLTPQIEETLENRISHIEALVNNAKQLETESKKLEQDAFIALEDAEIESAAAETKLMTSFREQSIKEKNMLYDMFSKKSKAESRILSTSVDNVFAEISDNLDGILDLAMKSIDCSFPVSKKRGDTL